MVHDPLLFTQGSYSYRPAGTMSRDEAELLPFS
jgi:hypothetical protein